MQKILIVEDHELTRAGLKLLLSQNPQAFEIEFLDCGAAVMPFLNSTDVDIIILDLDLPDMNGSDLLAELIGVHDITVMVLTGRRDPKEFEFIRKMGTRAVVSKADDSKYIIEGLIEISHGQTYLSPTVKKALGTYQQPDINLSPRQMAILHYLGIGETNKEIGYKLGIAAPTVSFHLAELRQKLSVDNNKRIVPKARSLKLL